MLSLLAMVMLPCCARTGLAGQTAGCFELTRKAGQLSGCAMPVPCTELTTCWSVFLSCHPGQAQRAPGPSPGCWGAVALVVNTVVPRRWVVLRDLAQRGVKVWVWFDPYTLSVQGVSRAKRRLPCKGGTIVPVSAPEGRALPSPRDTTRCRAAPRRGVCAARRQDPRRAHS